MTSALISVSDKTGVVELSQGLQVAGIRILSTGGTADLLRKHSIAVTEVAELTGFPEIMGGRVKTLHPKVHGGILSRRAEDQAVMDEHQIESIDFVVVNLYPFRETIAQDHVTLASAIENIDIGGPAMIRSAAKNHKYVTVVTDPSDYAEVGAAVAENGVIAADTRFKLACKAFAHTSAYDSAISGFLGQQLQQPHYPQQLTFDFNRVEELRYGENPHQSAAFYRQHDAPPNCIAGASQHHGKALSYNNIADADAALECVKSIAKPGCVIVKHANPCGVATAENLLDAYDKAYACDSESAFGGIIAFNAHLDKAVAEKIIGQQFVEVIVAPSFDSEVLSILEAKPAIRLLTFGETDRNVAALDFKRITGGLLVQTPDRASVAASDLKIVTKVRPDSTVTADLLFAWRVVKFVKSNAIVYCKDGRTLGIGAGQMSRVNSARIAASKAADAGLELNGCVMASDAFFPFRDSIDRAAEQGVSAIIQPGGSMRDDEVIEAADEHGIAMAFTSVRHFRH